MTGLVFGFGLGAYMLGATVLLVLGAERLLLVVLAPGVLGSAAFLLLGRPPTLSTRPGRRWRPRPLLAVGLATVRAGRGPSSAARAVCGACSTAAANAGGATRPNSPGQRGGRSALPGQLWGRSRAPGSGWSQPGCWFPSRGRPARPSGVNTGAVLASLPLALSMGMAEWTLIWFRRRGQRLLRNTRSLPAFADGPGWRYSARSRSTCWPRRRADRHAVVSVAAATSWCSPHWAVLPEVSAYLALGGAMFLALLLQAFGSRVFPLLACAVALASRGRVARSRRARPDRGLRGLLIVLAGYAALPLGEGGPPRALGRFTVHGIDK